ncbi:TetR/AcrR family transcriptional regulator [Streptomyces galilaeus]|uniref:TetR/AcrR family transcriptional regulator n=1 Tax=Streptomyces galilaeus TaxID=33899 RepID=UPI00167B9E3F|nr:TetR family transcriptional regulator [Streptomyces galilaeus]GGW79708.1 TetR family transcriptional regulator [Streptomyces galilaeus]
MGRWAPDARGRLEYAALELYAQVGFERTTVKEIAQRAGLTERTFFRHFADKREVLFPGNQQLQEVLEQAVTRSPAALTPAEAVTAALLELSTLMEDRRELARQRQTVIAAHPELQERELAKLASWSQTLTGALMQRGTAPSEARLTAEAGLAVFKTAFERWTASTDPRHTLGQFISDTFDDLRRLFTHP